MIANDTDPDGDALTLTAVQGTRMSVLDGTTVRVDTFARPKGLMTGSYTVTDARGATATGNVQVFVNSIGCDG